MIRKIFKWVFKSELIKLGTAISDCKVQETKIKNMLGNIDVSVDLHHYSPSWAVISIQGERSDYIKFIDLGVKDIREIQQFLRRFDRSKVDCSPTDSKYFKII